MSHPEVEAIAVKDPASRAAKKRKAESQELEIDIDAPEPPSKKAARKAKRQKSLNAPGSKNEITGQNVSVPSKVGDSTSNDRSPYGIWIGNLSFSTTKQDLQDFITGDIEHSVSEAEVTRVHLPLSTARNGPKSQNKGFAYVDFSTSPAQENALQLSEKLLGGRRVLIKRSKDFEGRPDDSQLGQKSTAKPPNKRIFVGNLSFDMTKEDLESHFEACGSLTNVHMATFEDSGKCKGYAWVEFEEVASAAAAVRGWVESSIAGEALQQNKMHKRRHWVNKFNGRTLRAEFAEDKTTRYNKRFGKNPRSEADDDQDAKQTLASSIPFNEKNNAALAELGGVGIESKVSDISSLNGTTGRGRNKSNRYDNETVTKITGAIVRGEGTKTTFD